MEVLAHGHTLATHAVLQVDILQELVGHQLQGILWPRLSWSREEWVWFTTGQYAMDNFSIQLIVQLVRVHYLEPVDCAAVDKGGEHA